MAERVGGLLAGDEARTAAIEYAAVNPTGDLLGVGRGHALYRVEIGEVRLAFGTTLVDLDVDEFRAARPVPIVDDQARHDVSDRPRS